MDTASSAIQVPELPAAAAAAAGEFELFFNDSNVETDKQMAYIVSFWILFFMTVISFRCTNSRNHYLFFEVDDGDRLYPRFQH